MKTKNLMTTGRRRHQQPGQPNPAVRFLLACCCLLLAASSWSQTNKVTWNASALTTGPSDGSGNWVGSTNWWSPDGGTNYQWSGGGNQDLVTFGTGTGAAGNYTITNNEATSQPFNITFTNSGSYTIVTDGGTTAGQLQTIIGGGGPSTNLAAAFYVATNVSAVINVPWRMVGGSDIFLGLNSSITFGQGSYGNLGQITIKGQSGPGLSVVNFTNGTVGGQNNPTGTTTADGATININGTAIVNLGTRFDIARSPVAQGGMPLAPAVVNVGGPGANAQLNVNTSATGNSSAGNNTGNHLQISRGGAAVLNILPGGFVSTCSYVSAGAVVSGNLRITPDSSSSGIVNMSGGGLYLGISAGGSPGSSSSALSSITLFDATATPGASGVAIFNLSGGTVAARSIIIGDGANWTANATNQINMSGGTLYLDAANISINTPNKNTGTNYAINLSGGTLAATANWSPACSVPINLTNLNGNITFQAADANGSGCNMAFSGRLTGQGGFYKTGPGTLTLSGANNYAGGTIVSNGTLVIVTAALPTNGPVALDASAGNPAVSVQVSGIGQYWSVGGLTFTGGTPTADFNYTNNLVPSTAVAPIQVNGNLAFTGTPNVTVDGSAIPLGTFPLITFTGSLSGTAPTAVTINLLGGSASGYLTYNAASKTIALVVTSSTFNPAIKWAAGSGTWDINATANWLSNGVASTFGNGDAVIFDDTASGASPITVAVGPTVQPANLSTENSTKSYTITGPGAIGGNASVNVLGSGSLTLSGANTYTGGTTVTAPGRLNINYGGNGGANSAIGTGPLTLNGGAVIDDTSGQAIALQTPVTENWAESFTFLGTTNLNTGLGMNYLSATLALTVASNVFEVDGPITDNGLNFGITKLGNGTLVLSNQYNAFSGGLTLSSGTLDINNNGADGSGLLTLAGGNLDNTSGALVSLSSSAIKWNGFTFLGTTSLDMGGSDITVLTSTMNIVSNTIYTEGKLNGANTTLTMNGPGTWMIGGGVLNTGGFGLNLNSGTVLCNRDYPYYAFTGALNISTNGTLVMYNPTGTQLNGVDDVNLVGGVADFNGDSEIFHSITFNAAGGAVRNGNQNSTSVLQPSLGISLGGTNCIFDITNGATMILSGIINSTGSVVKVGSGVLTLVSNNTFSGSVLVAGGTLALADPLSLGAGSISNSVLINVLAGATLDASGRMDQTFTLHSGQTLVGAGNVNGALATAPGSVLMPGNGIGTLTVANNVTLGGTAVFELNRSAAQTSDQLVSMQGTITGGGTLNVTNAGLALQAGDTFHLFLSGVSGFSNVNLPMIDANGYAYTWNDNIGTDGSITVATRTVALNPYPGPVQVAVSGSTLALGWPTNLGWMLQSQTNSLNAGLGNNWTTVAGSATVTNLNIPINPTNGSVFFRLVKPQ